MIGPDQAVKVPGGYLTEGFPENVTPTILRNNKVNFTKLF